MKLRIKPDIISNCPRNGKVTQLVPTSRTLPLERGLKRILKSLNHTILWGEDNVVNIEVYGKATQSNSGGISFAAPPPGGYARKKTTNRRRRLRRANPAEEEATEEEAAKRGSGRRGKAANAFRPAPIASAREKAASLPERRRSFQRRSNKTHIDPHAGQRALGLVSIPRIGKFGRDQGARKNLTGGIMG